MAQQRDPSELASLQSRQRQLEEQERSCSSTAADISEKIKRLKKARDQIADCKSNMSYLTMGGYDETDISYNSEPGLSTDRWSGLVREKYETKREDSLVESLEKYYKGLDNIEDDMNNKIRDLQNQQYENEGLWGDIKSALNNIATKIQNWWN